MSIVRLHVTVGAGGWTDVNVWKGEDCYETDLHLSRTVRLADHYPTPPYL